MDPIEELYSQLNILMNSGYSKKRIHYNSVKNFIKAIPSINNKNKREWIYSTLVSYFSFLKEKDLKTVDRKTSALLFNRYLADIGKFLYIYQGFYFVSGLNWLLFGFIADLILLFTGLSKHYLYIPIGILISYLIHFFISQIKKRKRKAYGLYY